MWHPMCMLQALRLEAIHQAMHSCQLGNVCCTGSMNVGMQYICTRTAVVEWAVTDCLTGGFGATQLVGRTATAMEATGQQDGQMGSPGSEAHTGRAVIPTYGDGYVTVHSTEVGGPEPEVALYLPTHGR